MAFHRIVKKKPALARKLLTRLPADSRTTYGRRPEPVSGPGKHAQFGEREEPSHGNDSNADAAGYYWDFLASGGSLTDRFAWQRSGPFNWWAISTAVNGRNPNNLAWRLPNYLRIRAPLSNPTL